MIVELNIENVALIKQSEINFSKGLNIISGETGSGKSMVIGAVNFMLGKRAGKDFIRLGENKAVVRGLFTIYGEDALNYMKESGIDIDEDNSLLIERSITDTGKSAIKANGKTITLAMLREIAGLLVDVHGQHDHRSLLNPSRHMDILDAFCPPEMSAIKQKLSELLKEYRALSRQAADITQRSGKSGERLEELKFQIDEIKAANLYADEEEILTERHKTLLYSEKLKENTENIQAILYDDMESGGILSRLNQAIRLSQEIGDMDKDAAYISERLQTVSIELEELKRDLSAYRDGIDSDGYELRQTEERLETIYSLKRKYGRTVVDILDFMDAAKKEYQELIGADQTLMKINGRRKALNGEIIEACQNLRQLRINQARLIEGQLEDVLKELGMKDARFEIRIEEKKEFGVNGNDLVEFLISPNLGEPLKELAKIASGGEMSRVMLALKTVISKADHIETFIFDEIDTGVSGRTAQKVAEKLALIASGQQIICITHLPQIAAMGDNHLLIEKITEGQRTQTVIHNLDRTGQVKEIARLLGGAKTTEAAINNAGELKNMADQYKRGV